MVERGWRGEAKKAVLPFLSFPCHTFPSLSSLLLLSSPTLLYAPLEINFWNFSFVPFQSLCTPGKIYRRGSIFKYNSEQERERREKGVQLMGAGGKLTQAKRCREASEDWVHRLRVGLTSRHHTRAHTRKNFSPPGCFGFLDVYGLQACIFTG